MIPFWLRLVSFCCCFVLFGPLVVFVVAVGFAVDICLASLVAVQNVVLCFVSIVLYELVILGIGYCVW